jgi:hypothetical protein
MSGKEENSSFTMAFGTFVLSLASLSGLLYLGYKIDASIQAEKAAKLRRDAEQWPRDICTLQNRHIKFIASPHHLKGIRQGYIKANASLAESDAETKASLKGRVAQLEHEIRELHSRIDTLQNSQITLSSAKLDDRVDVRRYR